MINGAIASTNLNMNNFDIINANMITSANILSLNAPNATEVGTPLRRQLQVAVEVQNTGSLAGSNSFQGPENYINAPSFSIPTVDTIITTVTVAGGYDDGNNGNTTMTVSLYQDDGGVETNLGSVNTDLGSSLNTVTLTFSPSITLNPSPTKTYFVRLSVGSGLPATPQYGIVSGGTVFCILVGNQLQSVSDPIEFFNVYGNSFFQDNMLVHANVTLANPANDLYKTVLEYNYIECTAPPFSTQVGAGQIFINNGAFQNRQQATNITMQNTGAGGFDGASMGLYSLSFTQVALRSGIYSSSELQINQTSGSIGRVYAYPGVLELNQNDNGGIINLRKDSISTVGQNLSTISTYGRGSDNINREWARIQTIAENVTTNNQDARIAISTIVNGTLSEVWNFNGGQNEANSFRPLDMNGNNIRTTLGNIALTATASTGVGNTTIQSKVGANVIIDTGATGRVNFITATTTATPNHNVNFQSTSNSVASASYLRMQLNGVDIWVPYLTTNPSL